MKLNLTFIFIQFLYHFRFRFFKMLFINPNRITLALLYLKIQKRKIQKKQKRKQRNIIIIKEMSSIEQTNYKHKIIVIPGDGIGPEVMAEAEKIFKALELPIQRDYVDWGVAHFLSKGKVVPPDFISEVKQYDAILLGSLGDPSKFVTINDRVVEKRFPLGPCHQRTAKGRHPAQL